MLRSLILQAERPGPGGSLGGVGKQGRVQLRVPCLHVILLRVVHLAHVPHDRALAQGHGAP
eukprot:3387112-Pyramimonas_sp.AAC.1